MQRGANLRRARTGEEEEDGHVCPRGAHPSGRTRVTQPPGRLRAAAADFGRGEETQLTAARRAATLPFVPSSRTPPTRRVTRAAANARRRWAMWNQPEPLVGGRAQQQRHDEKRREVQLVPNSFIRQMINSCSNYIEINSSLTKVHRRMFLLCVSQSFIYIPGWTRLTSDLSSLQRTLV